MNNNEKEWFDVDNKYLADGINYGTGERYFCFTNTETNKVFYRFKYSYKVYAVFKSLVESRKKYLNI